MKEPRSPNEGGDDTLADGSHLCDDLDVDRLAASILDAAEEIEARDAKLRQAIVQALDRGEVAEARRLVQAWEFNGSLSSDAQRVARCTESR